MTIVNTTGWPHRSAELFDAWLDKDPADVSALIAEIVESNDDPVDVMSSLLYVGGCLIRAAIGGDIEETFDRLLSDAVAAEALT